MNIDSGNLGSGLGGGEGSLVGSMTSGESGIGNVAGGGQKLDKAQIATQASDMLDKGMSVVTGEQTGPKVGTDVSELGTEQTVNPETGEVKEEPKYQQGDKVGNGKVVGEDGKIQGSNTRRMLTDVGTGVATYFGGAEAGKAVYDVGQNNELVGKVADTADKIPGVEQLSNELEDAGVLDTAEGAFSAFNAAKSGDVKGTVEGVKKTAKGVGKARKKIIKNLIISVLPAVLFLIIVICIGCMVNYGAEKLLESIDGSNAGDGATTVEPGSEDGGSTSETTDLKLKKYFPNGVPKTQSEIETYIVTISVPITTKSGQKTTQSIRVHKDIQNEVIDVLQKAQDAGFKVYSVAGYNYRSVRGSSNKLSQHSYGLAIDINPDENYYIKGNETIGNLYDPDGNEYSMPADGIVVKTFKSYGWDWGGDWKSLKDYMHFSAAGG